MSYKPNITPSMLNPKTDLQNKTPYGVQTNLSVCQLGTPVISWVQFYNDTNNLTIAECVITVNQSPNVTKTKALGKDGSVKTYIGKNDYEITIEGYLFNLTAPGIEGVYPTQRMNMLQSFLNNQGNTFGIQIYSPYLELFDNTGIQWVVITNVEFPQEEGMYSQQKFTIDCISDSYNDAALLYSPYIP